MGDDSPDDNSTEVINKLASQTGVRIHYVKNTPPLGQNDNTNSLYDLVTTSHLILLHDDDLLLPNSIEDLLSCWSAHPRLTAAYGKQYVISHEGAVDLHGSLSLNNAYARTADRQGLQPNDWETGILQQFPNDGFMILASAAKSVRWRSREVVGGGGEFDFGLRLGLIHRGFYFLNEYTAKYRKTESGSISGSKSDNAALYSYRLLLEAQLPHAAEQLRSRRLREIAPRALMQAINCRKLGQAWDIYWSSNHGWRGRMSPGGVRRLLFMLIAWARHSKSRGAVNLS